MRAAEEGDNVAMVAVDFPGRSLAGVGTKSIDASRWSSCGCASSVEGLGQGMRKAESPCPITPWRYTMMGDSKKVQMDGLEARLLMHGGPGGGHFAAAGH